MTESNDLQQIPGVGPRTQEALEDLGIGRVADLVGRDPGELYRSMMEKHGYQDPCVLYVFRCAVYYAEAPRRDPELLKWWNWRSRVHANERGSA
jgi:hypothetical protein